MAIPTTKWAINRHLSAPYNKTKLLRAAANLERNISMYEAVFAWPLLFSQLRADAERLRQAARIKNGTPL